MIRVVLVLLTLSLIATLLPAADDRAPDELPAKLKKKDPGKEQPMSDPEEAASTAHTKELLGRVAKNMEQSEDRLKKQDPGKETRAIQDQIVKDLDELIKKSQEQDEKNKNSQQSLGQKSKSSSQMSRQSRRQSRKQSGQQQAGGQKNEQNKMDPQGKKEQMAGAKQGQDKQNKAGNTPGGGGTSTEKKSTIADLFRDVWGHLPEQKRQEMDAYSRERFMPRYDELLRQYYRTISEQGRKKE